MPSLQSQLLFTILRNRNLLKLHLKKETWDWNTSIPRFRQECEDGAKKAGKLPEDIEVSPVHIGGLPVGLSAEWVRPRQSPSAQAQAGPAIFYTHGGGYVSGSCSDHQAQVAKVVQASGVPALLYEYRLAPEHPFPAAIDDTLVAYNWLLDQGFKPERIAIMGESAGGGLCLATLLALQERSLPLPVAAVALSPWTDLKLTGESYRTRAHACLAPAGMSLVCSKYYAGDHDPALPLISPLYGDLHGLPPTLIYVGNDETMRDDSILYSDKARSAGVEVRLKVWEGMGHCFPLLAPLFPEAVQALQEIAAFIQSHVC